MVIYFLHHVRPYKQDKLNKLDILNEVMDLVVLFHLMMFAALDDELTKDWFGLSLVSFILFSVSTHLISSFYEIAKRWKAFCKEKMNKRKQA